MGIFDSIKESLDDLVFTLTTNDRYATLRTSHLTQLNAAQNTYTPPEASSGYRPGMRSHADIAMRDYASAVPMSELLGRLEKVLLEEFPDLVDYLNDPATPADLNELENDLGVTLPMDVRESYQIYDGQERGGKPSGVIMGLTWLDIESVAEEYMVWQTAAQKIERERAAYKDRLAQYKQQQQQPQDGKKTKKMAPPVPRIDFVAHQRSFPEGAIQPVYVHSGWVPLVKDFSGNNIAIDLAPGPKGKWGQVICFGQDFDTKFVVADSWSKFWELVVKDFEAGNLWVDQQYDELWYAEKGTPLNYFDVLKKRFLPAPPKRGPPPALSQKAPVRLAQPQFPKKMEMPKETLIQPGEPEKEPVKTETERVAEKATLEFDKNEVEEVEEEEEETPEADIEGEESKPLQDKPKEFI